MCIQRSINEFWLSLFECLVQRTVNVKSRPRLPIPDDEDPYSIAGNNFISNENSDSSGYSGSSNSNSNGKLHLQIFKRKPTTNTTKIPPFKTKYSHSITINISMRENANYFANVPWKQSGTMKTGSICQKMIIWNIALSMSKVSMSRWNVFASKSIANRTWMRSRLHATILNTLTLIEDLSQAISMVYCIFKWAVDFDPFVRSFRSSYVRCPSFRCTATQ